MWGPRSRLGKAQPRREPLVHRTISMSDEHVTERKTLTPAAERALAEAAERRAALDARAREAAPSKELHGRGGLEPVRYDDWEIKGIACDF
jgi:hypothetical protein